MIRGLYERVLNLLSDRQAVSLDFFLAHKRFPQLQPPRTFSEKVIYRKITDRDPRMAPLADKVLVKAHVAQVLGAEWVIPTIWHGAELPARDARRWPVPYVLKANHGCGWNLFIRSEADEDWDRIERITARWLGSTQGQPLREWLYAGIEPQLLVEPFIGGDASSAPTDYKVFVFGGRALYIQVDRGRFQDHRRSFFDREWNRQPFTSNYPLDSHVAEAPGSLGKMLGAAETLGAGFSFVRVDFYEIDGNPLFGEMTFYPGSGRVRFDPSTYDALLGELWKV